MTKHALSYLELLLSVLMFTGCDGGGSESGGNGDNRGDCVQVMEGEWEFDFSFRGLVFLSFVKGELTQSDCFLSYDADEVFTGTLDDDQWSVEVGPDLTFTGTFRGDPGTRFDGTFRSSGQIGNIRGDFVGN